MMNFKKGDEKIKNKNFNGFLFNSIKLPNIFLENAINDILKIRDQSFKNELK